MRHRRYLRKNHPYRSKAEYFDNTVEDGDPPESWKGDKVFTITKKLKVVFGKAKKKETNKRKRNEAKEPASASGPFKKHSIFFKYLPYWQDLEIRHSIDVMHLEKNVFDSTLGTLLDITSKTKDGLKSRKDLVNMQIRKELHPVDEGNGKVYLPPACYTLTNEEKKAMCNCLRGVRVPTSFSSNIKRLVSMNDLSFSGYNSHDCHVMLTVFLAIAIRAIEPLHVKVVIRCGHLNGTCPF